MTKAAHRASTRQSYTRTVALPDARYNRRSLGLLLRFLSLGSHCVMASQSGPIRVVHFGLGPIGTAVVRQIAGRRGFRIVGAVDIDPEKVGKDLGEVARLDQRLKVKVSDNAKKTIASGKPDVVVHCTSSSMKRVLPQLETILKLKVPVVSTTEELSYPSKGNLRY